MDPLLDVNQAPMRTADDEVLDVVTRFPSMDLTQVLARVRQERPDVTSLEVAESVSRLHRRGLIRIDEARTRVNGETIRTAILTLP